ncbi:MAG: hypothetical protein GF346_10830 [Candidatus Eisenbacteria bacterium]|nr:hypothetical protein [Candidatus Latescibacterota bacterium]MBD3302931.1 hypothetical protein [Candidatus Eisenbacteria bacterium]
MERDPGRDPAGHPDRVWIGQLDPTTRAAVYEALERLGWRGREVACAATALSLTPQGAIGVLVQEGHPPFGAGSAEGLSVLWALPEGASPPPLRDRPPSDWIRTGATASEVESRLALLLRRTEAAASLDRLRRRGESDRIRQREIIRAIAQDLGGPLTALLDLLAGVEETGIGSEAPELDSRISIARRAATRLAARITGIADLGRFEAGEPIPVELHPVEIGPLLERWIQAREEATGKRQTLRLVDPGPLPPVCGDGARIEQILQRLVEGAGRSAPEGAAIRIRAEIDPMVAGTLLLLVEGRFEGSGGLETALVEALVLGLGGETVHCDGGRDGFWSGVRLPIWESRFGRIARAQAALSAADGPDGGLAVWRVCGPASRAGESPAGWRSLSPDEVLVIDETAPREGTPLGQVRELRRPGAIETALAPRLRFEPVRAEPALEVA